MKKSKISRKIGGSRKTKKTKHYGNNYRYANNLDYGYANNLGYGYGNNLGYGDYYGYANNLGYGYANNLGYGNNNRFKNLNNQNALNQQEILNEFINDTYTVSLVKPKKFTQYNKKDCFPSVLKMYLDIKSKLFNNIDTIKDILQYDAGIYNPENGTSFNKTVSNKINKYFKLNTHYEKKVNILTIMTHIDNGKYIILKTLSKNWHVVLVYGFIITNYSTKSPKINLLIMDPYTSLDPDSEWGEERLVENNDFKFDNLFDIIVLDL